MSPPCAVSKEPSGKEGESSRGSTTVAVVSAITRVGRVHISFFYFVSFVCFIKGNLRGRIGNGIGCISGDFREKGNSMGLNRAEGGFGDCLDSSPSPSLSPSNPNRFLKTCTSASIFIKGGLSSGSCCQHAFTTSAN